MRLAAATLLLSFGINASAHRLDEYLQATTISLEKQRVQAQIRLTPGIAVFPFVLATIDTNADGVISTTEQQAYAERVLRDLSLAVDGESLSLQLISTNFPETDEMKEGRGEIKIEVAAYVPTHSPDRKLTFENHHLKPIAAYLVNCLVPRDPDIRVTAQNRNYEQSIYQLNYLQGGVQSGPLSLARASDGRNWLAFLAILLLARLAVLLRQRHAQIQTF